MEAPRETFAPFAVPVFWLVMRCGAQVAGRLRCSCFGRRLQIEARKRDLAMFNLAIDSKLTFWTRPEGASPPGRGG
jgi:hypothetical protein